MRTVRAIPVPFAVDRTNLELHTRVVQASPVPTLHRQHDRTTGHGNEEDTMNEKIAKAIELLQEAKNEVPAYGASFYACARSIEDLNKWAQDADEAE